MDSDSDTAEAVGFPIRKSSDQCLLAAPRSLSQRATSFIASQCQGIHQMPLRRLILEAVDCATRRNKPARDLSRRKMLRAPVIVVSDGNRTHASSVTHYFARHLSKTPTCKHVEPSRKSMLPSGDHDL